MSDFRQRALREPQRPLRLPENFANVTLNGIQNEPVRTLVRDYLKNFWDCANAGIAPLLSGAMGTYKTYGACVIARFVSAQTGINVEFFDTPGEVPQLDRGWYDGTAAKRMHELDRAPLLIVDDFTRIRPTGRDIAIMDEIGNLRYNSGLPTIWTANIGITTGSIASLVSAPFERRLLTRSKGYRLVLNAK